MQILRAVSLSILSLNAVNGFSCYGTNDQAISKKQPCLAAFARRAIPYVETHEEQQVRELWDKDPFHTVKKVVDKVLKEGFTEEPLLSRGEDVLPNSGYEDMFDPLYSRPNFIEPSPRNPYDKLHHFLIEVGYRGDDFCGWQRQTGNRMPSVQQTLEDWLTNFSDGLLTNGKVRLRVCGRTDAGVHAIGQVCRLRTRMDVESSAIQSHLDKLPHSGLKCTSVTEVTRAFHPLFSATCRAYAYMIDVPESDIVILDRLDRLNEMLQALEGRELSFIGLSYGRLKTLDASCTLYHARACRLESGNDSDSVLCIELVGNRFLRRMVRLLVQAAMHLLRQQELPSKDALLHHVQKEDRSLISMPAPPDGLMFVSAGFNSWR